MSNLGEQHKLYVDSDRELSIIDKQIKALKDRETKDNSFKYQLDFGVQVVNVRYGLN